MRWDSRACEACLVWGWASPGGPTGIFSPHLSCPSPFHPGLGLLCAKPCNTRHSLTASASSFPHLPNPDTIIGGHFRGSLFYGSRPDRSLQARLTEGGQGSGTRAPDGHGLTARVPFRRGLTVNPPPRVVSWPAFNLWRSWRCSLTNLRGRRAGVFPTAALLP